MILLILLIWIRCSLDMPAGLEIALDCVVDCNYLYKHKMVIISTPKQAFDELRPGFEGVTHCYFSMDTYAFPKGVLNY